MKLCYIYIKIMCKAQKTIYKGAWLLIMGIIILSFESMEVRDVPEKEGEIIYLLDIIIYLSHTHEYMHTYILYTVCMCYTYYVYICTILEHFGL